MTEGAGARDLVPDGVRKDGGPGGGGPEDAVPRVLADVRELVESTDEGSAGALWKLAESGRQLDANVVHLPPGRGVDPHAEPLLDVMLLVLGGDGTLATVDGPQRLTEGTLLWLPHGARRALTAGERGLYYLTVHRRRPGMFPHRLKGVGGGTSHARGGQWGSTPSRRAAEPAAATLDPAVSEALPRAGERPTALVKARMLFTDSRGRVLLVRLQPVGERPWGLPGGTVETGSESPRAAAVRETAEELGLDCTPGRLLSVDWVTRPDDRPRVVHVFDGGRLADHRLARIRLDEDELAEWRMCPPGEAEELLTDAGWGQLKESLAALTSGTGPVELVDGVPPGA